MSGLSNNKPVQKPATEARPAVDRLPRRRLDDRLYIAKVLAGAITTALLGGLLYIAVDRDINHEYIPYVAAALAILLVGLPVSVFRRVRRRGAEKAARTKPTGALAAAAVIGVVVGALAALLRRIVRSGH